MFKIVRNSWKIFWDVIIIRKYWKVRLEFFKVFRYTR